MARELAAASTEELLVLASTSTQAELVGQVVATLVTRYKGLVYNQALRVSGKNHALADEIFQETFLRLFKWLRGPQVRQPLHSFPKLLTVFAKRAAIDVMRKEVRETPSVSAQEASVLPAVEDDPSWETKAYVLELLEQLDERSREVISLTYFGGLSAVEIAEKLNLEPGHVRILRFRALEALRTRKERDEKADSVDPL